VPAAYPIRPARVEDVPALGDVERAAATLFAPYGLAELFSETSAPEKLEDAARDGRLWVATDAAGTVVGFALAALVGGTAHLDELDVHPAHGRRGVGRALIDAVIAWARAHGHRALTLNTMRDVPWNAPYYERLGFVILPDDALPPALAELRRREVEHGLPGERRVSMRRALD
jgi:GNAT superfamily N-acetyltransferase